MKARFIIVMGACIMSSLSLQAATLRVHNQTDRTITCEYPYELFGNRSTKSVTIKPGAVAYIDTGLSDTKGLRFIDNGQVTEGPTFSAMTVEKHVYYRGSDKNITVGMTSPKSISRKYLEYI